MTTQHQARLPAATAAAIDALRRLAALLGADVACILLNTADLLDQAQGDTAAGEMHPSDQAIAEHIRQQIAGFSCDPGQRSMASVSAPGFLAEARGARWRAIDLAEISRDLLCYAARDARHLANAARRMVGAVVTDHDGIGQAMTIAFAADELAAKIESMVGEVSPGLGELVAMDSREHSRH